MSQEKNNHKRLLHLIEVNVPISSIIQLYNTFGGDTYDIVDPEYTIMLDPKCRQYIRESGCKMSSMEIIHLVFSSYFYETFRKLEGQDMLKNMSETGERNIDPPQKSGKKEVAVSDQVDQDFVEMVFERHRKRGILENIEITGGLDDVEGVDVLTRDRDVKMGKKYPNMTSTAEQQFLRIRHFSERVSDTDFIITEESMNSMLDRMEEDLPDNERYSLQTKSAYLFALKVFLGLLTTKEKVGHPFLSSETLYNRIGDMIDTVSGRIHEKQMEHSFNDKEKKNHMSWDKLVSLVVDYYQRNKKCDQVNIIQNMILSRLLVLENSGCPRRLEFASLKVSEGDDDKTNTVDLHTRNVYLNDYKTFKTYGKYRFKIGKETASLIGRLTKLTQKPNLFEISNFSKYTTKVLRIITGKEVNQNLLRKLCVNNLNDKGLLKYEADVQELAKAMGNSPNSIRKYYQKREFEYDDDSDED